MRTVVNRGWRGKRGGGDCEEKKEGEAMGGGRLRGAEVKNRRRRWKVFDLRLPLPGRSVLNAQARDPSFVVFRIL